MNEIKTLIRYATDLAISGNLSPEESKELLDLTTMALEEKRIPVVICIQGGIVESVTNCIQTYEIHDYDIDRIGVEDSEILTDSKGNKYYTYTT